jgi:UDP-4-amino-4,6-dideoxy-N-acetyl-beta-L-altrosamine transaminase
VMNIPYGKHYTDKADLEAVIDVLQGGMLTQGPLVPKFEVECAAFVGSQYAIAVSNATSGLHLACLALDIGPGSMVWTSAITFVASANCAIYCGSEIDFVDIDFNTVNICPRALAKKLWQAKKTGGLPDLLVVVHMAGLSADMVAIKALSEEFGFAVIEDASHAFGGSFKSGKIGACDYSDLAVFSFHPVKMITTAEGGIITTNDEKLAKKIAMLRSHGIVRGADMPEPSDGDWHYQQTDMGFNFRMPDLLAALGLSQLKKIDDFLLTRRAIASRYDELLSDFSLIKPDISHVEMCSWHLYIVRIDGNLTQHKHAEIYRALHQQGVKVGLHYMPVYRHPFYRQRGCAQDQCPIAEQYYTTAFSLPIFYDLEPFDQQQVVEKLRMVI